ncbi:MAG: substrate-binding domain-containing protein [Methanomicrobiales archaeon]|nr:substrate-binding domain-containing protein [Methanomicrobiales archaeon]
MCTFQNEPTPANPVVTLVVVALLLVALSLVGCMGKEQGSYVNGTLNVSAGQVLAKSLKEATDVYAEENPAVQVTVRDVGSVQALDEFISGRSDLALLTQLPLPEEYMLAEQQGKRIHLTTFAIDGIAIIVPNDNELSGITLADARKIFFEGTLSTWEQVPGSGQRGHIRVYTGNVLKHATAQYFNYVVAGNRTAPYITGAIPLSELELIPDAVKSSPDAIGYDSLVYLTRSGGPMVLPVDGVIPAQRALLDGTYPLARNVYLLTDGPPRGVAGSYVAFLLSPRGQELIGRSGLVPVSLIRHGGNTG